MNEVKLHLVMPGRLSFLATAALNHALGKSLDECVAPVLAGPAFDRLPPHAAMERCYPLLLGPQKGFWFEIPFVGQLGLFNDAGLLRITVPPTAREWLIRNLGDNVSRGPLLSQDGRSSDVWVSIKPGLVVWSQTLLDTYTIKIEGR